jgi:hypothetical protein
MVPGYHVLMSCALISYSTVRKCVFSGAYVTWDHVALPVCHMPYVQCVQHREEVCQLNSFSAFSLSLSAAKQADRRTVRDRLTELLQVTVWHSITQKAGCSTKDDIKRLRVAGVSHKVARLLLRASRIRSVKNSVWPTRKIPLFPSRDSSRGRGVSVLCCGQK